MDVDIVQDLQAESLFVDVDVANEEDAPGFCGHRINDGAIVETNDEQGILHYYRESRRLKNCVHVPFGPSPLLAIITTKKVKPGRELFTTYGCSYWLDVLTEASGEEETDMTDAIVAEARAVAMDVLQGMKSAALRHAKEAQELEEIFSES
ncbi:MAG: hypothetical protein SGARI_008275 [Bacillariaceae sp.]